ncbi:MAG: hypothetical protein M3Y27_02945 [Acidobacteriota bacterium]|nr:hypothetical protein [Acidobacteriota bacterium]
MPALGPLGTAIVIYLRGACYHNRKSGETRDSVQICQREIAAGCGCSVPTIKRELERNAPLRRFVQISPEWERNGTSGRVRQLENHYKVAMDDPLTEADEARLKELVAERIRQDQLARSRPGERPRKPIRLKEATQPVEVIQETETGLTACSKAGLHSVIDEVCNECSDAVNTASSKMGFAKEHESLFVEQSPVAQNELLRPVAHFESTPVQNELLSVDSLLKTTQKEQTLNVGEAFHFVAEERKTGETDHSTQDREGILKSLNLRESAEIVEELKDWGSERRHRQLLSVCEQHGLLHLPKQALAATRQRLAQETKLGVLERPGAYYQKVLIKLLADQQVFVPSLAEKSDDNPEEVRHMIRASLGLSPENPLLPEDRKP